MHAPGPQRREWSHFAAILTLGLCVVAGSAWAQTPSVRCEAVIARDRALVDVTLNGFVDDRLARLVKLGLSGRIQLEVALLQRRPFWFDDFRDRAERESVLRYDRGLAAFLLDSELEVADPVTLRLDRIALRPVDGLPDGDYRVEVKVSLRVVTPQGLGKVAAWLAGREQREGGAAPSALLEAVANDLARTASTSCAAKRLPPPRP